MYSLDYVYMYIHIYLFKVCQVFWIFYVLFAYSKGGILFEISQKKSSNFISYLSIETRTILHCYQVTTHIGQQIQVTTPNAMKAY